MLRLDTATIVSDDETFDSIKGPVHEAIIEYRFNTQFTIDKTSYQSNKDGSDVIVSGPVYVGDDKMLDRHRELVEADAIMKSWDSYAVNPVILYNHRKDYGVIGVMESVEMGTFTKADGTEINAVIGRARIDGGEEAISRKIRKGMLRAFSIGFIAKAAVKEGDGDDAYLKFVNIEWIETSVVDIPASPNAVFDVTKSVVKYDGDSEPIGGDTVKTLVENGQGMTEEEIVVAATEEEDLTVEEEVTLSTEEENIELSEEVVETKDSEEAEEEVEETTEEAEEEVVELSEEVEIVKEEEVEEEITVDTITVMSEVVVALSQVEAGITALTSRLDETESLKATLAERDATIAALTEEKSVAEAEAAIEAEVSKRLAEKVAEAGLPSINPERKTLASATKSVVEEGVTKLDPTPPVTEGMVGMVDWLENRLTGRGGV